MKLEVAKKVENKSFYDPCRPHPFRSVGDSAALWGTAAEVAEFCLFFMFPGSLHNMPPSCFSSGLTDRVESVQRKDNKKCLPAKPPHEKGGKKTSVRLVPVSQCDRSLSAEPVLEVARHDKVCPYWWQSYTSFGMFDFRTDLN